MGGGVSKQGSAHLFVGMRLFLGGLVPPPAPAPVPPVAPVMLRTIDGEGGLVCLDVRVPQHAKRISRRAKHPTQTHL